MLYDITPPKRILFNVGIAFISPLPRCRDNFSNVPTDNHGRFMNFYSTTFKICDTRSEVFRLSGYFEIPRRYFCRLLITLIPLKPPRIVSLHFSPFFATVLCIFDNPCQNPIEYGQEINGIFPLSSGAASGVDERKKGVENPAKNEKRVYETRGSYAN